MKIVVQQIWIKVKPFYSMESLFINQSVYVRFMRRYVWVMSSIVPYFWITNALWRVLLDTPRMVEIKQTFDVKAEKRDVHLIRLFPIRGQALASELKHYW